MGASKIEQLIEDIYEFIESCKMKTFSSTQVIVPKDELYDLLDELRLRTPDEIKRYQKVITNREAILEDAKKKAAEILAQAQEKTSALISEHEIMQQAYFQANEVVSNATQEAQRILDEANNDADQIRSGALVYAEDMLTDIENILNNAYESTRTRYEGLLESLRGNLEIVINNKRELTEPQYTQPEQLSPEELRNPQEMTGDFDFDENTFLEDIDGSFLPAPNQLDKK